MDHEQRINVKFCFKLQESAKGWRLKGGWSLLKSDSPRQSSNTVLIITRCYNAVVWLWRRVQENR